MAELGASMSSAEFSHWLAMDELEPCGPLADDFRAGTIAATFYNMNRSSKAEAASAADFMPALARALNGYAVESADEDDDEELDIAPEDRALFLDALFGLAGR